MAGRGEEMPADPTTRELIVKTADELFYQRGFDKTSFSDISEIVGISRGNFYHHFKSKDDILTEVISLRFAKTQGMLDRWTQAEATPAGRLRRFAHMLIENRKEIQRYGCPVGTLCSELAKLDHPSQSDAGMIFGQFRDWLRTQFEQMGRVGDSDALAMHLLARSQGVAVLATAFQDEAFIRREVVAIAEWLEGLSVPSRDVRASKTR
jgi:TetR/AcrR family transcriptional regulator, transcriptional repressor for nem operon